MTDDNWIEQIKESIAEGLQKNLTYNRLFLTKANFAKTTIRNLNLHGINVEIIEGNQFNIKTDTLIDMDKTKITWIKTTNGYVPLITIINRFKQQEVIKEITLNIE